MKKECKIYNIFQKSKNLDELENFDKKFNFVNIRVGIYRYKIFKSEPGFARCLNSVELGVAPSNLCKINDIEWSVGG
jgi:hypothetical protein